MSRPLPISLSPHVCVLESPDLSEVLEGASLPSLPNILQSFSPLPQVTTRTTTLVSVPHNSFALRFSTLADVENACREDDESRAIRTVDWMTARINKRCQKWVQDMEALGGKETLRTPWWDELRRCAEGDVVPTKTEGWNHPVALILAVSTTAPNPLAAITALHARYPQFPSWVDTTYLKYTLIVHPRNSPLSDEEATALFNAVKKQFGLHTYLLPLELPPTAPFVTVPALLPRLPTNPGPESPPQQHTQPSMSPGAPGAPPVLNTLKMDETDIQHTARFTREFLVMSLLPWMEKCVVEWNENFSATRRLPSRLFSSTRRLFGSQPTTPSPTPPPGSGQPRSSLQLANGPAPPSQQRRLAEFATILGDMKLAVTVWEALRKEKKGGFDVLPLLLAPSASIPLYAQAALQSLDPAATDYPPHVQTRALVYAARWEAGIGSTDFLSNTLEGERWLVWAANNAEEAPSALLLAHAALLSYSKRSFRRAALWYVLAANRLEKCGIKPLTKYFLKKAQDIYEISMPKELSPSFWDSEGKSANSKEGLEDILSGIEHPLSRLLYTTGDVGGAVRLFLKLLRGAPGFLNGGLPLLNDGSSKTGGNDKVYLDDFKVAYQYWKSTEPEEVAKTQLQLPFKLCVAKSSRLRFPGDSLNAETDVWSEREDAWKTFCKSRDMNVSIAPSGKVCANDLFWVDLIMKNPLDAEVSLSNITVVVQEKTISEGTAISAFVEVETIKEVTLAPKATTSVPISLRSTRPTTLIIPEVKFDFLTLLPATESLACRGRRLHDTAQQRQSRTYAPDVVMQIQVLPAEHRLSVSFVEDQHLTLLQGENKSTSLWLVNSGSYPISEIWMVCGPDDEIWVGDGSIMENSTGASETYTSHNSLAPQEPRRIALETVLKPGESLEVPIIFHAESRGSQELFLLFLFREDDSKPFFSTKLSRVYEVQPLLEVSVTAEPSQLEDHAFILDVEVVNASQTSPVNIFQITSVSPQWTCDAISSDIFDVLAPSQSSRLLLGSSPWKEASGSQETLQFIQDRMDDVLKGRVGESTEVPPPINLCYSHISQDGKHQSTLIPAMSSFITSSRRKYVSSNIVRSHPYISPTSHPSIFPLYNPVAVDLVVFWEVPSQHKSGHLNVQGITLGASHAALDTIIEEAEGAKAKRSMYAETRRENMEVLDSIRASEWNMEMQPLVLSYKDTTPKVHDFGSGPCQLTVDYVIRNHSLTLPARFTLKLKPGESTSSQLMLPPPYYGRLTFRGEVPASGTVTVRPKLWLSRPGSYSLGSWTLDTSISLPKRKEGDAPRERLYSQGPSPVNEETTLLAIDSRDDKLE